MAYWIRPPPQPQIPPLWLPHRRPAQRFGLQLGNWLTVDEAQSLLRLPSPDTISGKRDRAILGIMLSCGLRRRELTELTVHHLERRENHWAIVDMIGKGGHIRTVPVPDGVQHAVDDWMAAAGIIDGNLFRCVARTGKVWGFSITEKAVWHIVKKYGASLGVPKLAPHDLRRSCAGFCHAAGGELEQIQFLLGHVSVQTTEKYLGCKQRLWGVEIKTAQSGVLAGFEGIHKLLPWAEIGS